MACMNLFAAGFLIGVGSVAPGVSGGSMAIAFGIYEKIETKRQNRYIKLLYKNDPQAQEEYKRKNPKRRMKYEIEKSCENRDSFLNPDFKISG